MAESRSFDLLMPGSVIEGPSVTLQPDHLEVVRGIGGYTHPLFTDPEHVRVHSPFAAQPLPAEWTLFLLGGLAEQSGVFDETTVALVGIDEVRFPAAALVGDTVSLEMTVETRRVVAEGRRGIVDLHWRAVNQRAEDVLTCRVSMLFRLDEPGPG